MTATAPTTESNVDRAAPGAARRCLTAARVFVAVSLALGAATCFVSGGTYFMMAPAGWLCATVALIVSIVALVRNARSERDLARHSRWRRCLGWVAAAAMLFGLQSASCIYMNHNFILADWSCVSSANLRGIYVATDYYHSEFKESPGSLQDLLKAELVADKQLVAPGDVNGWRATMSTTNPTLSPSYVYLPRAFQIPPDPIAVLAYEREPWSVHKFRMFPTFVHAVVFADGHVDFLTPAELQTAIGNAR